MSFEHCLTARVAEAAAVDQFADLLERDAHFAVGADAAEAFDFVGRVEAVVALGAVDGS